MVHTHPPPWLASRTKHYCILSPGTIHHTASYLQLEGSFSEVLAQKP